MCYRMNKLFYLITAALGILTMQAVFADHTPGINLSAGGRLKIDTIYNSNSISNGRKRVPDLIFSPATIPLADTDDDTDINIRESRFWATLLLPMFNEQFASYVEFDFYDTNRDADGVLYVTTAPRLRHLYVDYKGLTAGKTYTTFVNMSAYPEINDGAGPVGTLSFRPEAILRYRHTFGFGEMMLALEHGESLFTTSSGSRFRMNDDQLPNIVARLNVSEKWGNVSFAAMMRQINHNGSITNGADEREWGAAFSVAGRVFLRQQDNLRFMVSFGSVLGRYMSYGAFSDAVITSSGNINLNEIVSGFAAYQHWWTSRLRSSVIIGGAYANVDTANTVSSVDKYLASTTMNLLWSPYTSTTLGLEWLHGYRKQYDGRDGYIDRLQFSFIYKYN